MPYDSVPTPDLVSPPSVAGTFRPSPLNPKRASTPAASKEHSTPPQAHLSDSHSSSIYSSSELGGSGGPQGGFSASTSSTEIKHEGALQYNSSGSSHESGSGGSSMHTTGPSSGIQMPHRKPEMPPSGNTNRRATHRSHDSYADAYGTPASASGPDAGSLNAIAAGLIGASYGPFPSELTAAGMTGGLGNAGSWNSVPTLTQAGGRGLGQNRWAVTSAGDVHQRASSLSGNETSADFGVSSTMNSPRRLGLASVSPDMRNSYMSIGSGWGDDASELGGGGMYSDRFAETTDNLLWKEENKEPDDYLHDPDPILDRKADKRIIFFSRRGWLNVTSLGVLIAGVVSLFAFYPILTYVIRQAPGHLGWNLGGINGSGQYPDIPNLPQLIDRDTPDSVKERTGFDGSTKYELVFSDEFNQDGRTFWPGDDPFWEAVDLHYWQTTNYEWYDPDAIQTKGGNLEIALSEQPLHDLSFRSGMLQSWNQFCFTEGYIEVNVSLPGNPSATGMWPGAWTMGNLARAGFGATNEGMWPFSYGACDVGTLPNQTYPNGSTPTAAKTTGSSDYGGELSWSPGQRTSACTCAGQDHPGPKNSVGRSGPEIDIIEAQYGYGPSGAYGSASQSMQILPADSGYFWNNGSSGIAIHGTTAANSEAINGTLINTWHGSINQESLSGITITDGISYNGVKYQTFGFEYKRGYGSDGAYITWSYNGQPTWTVYANAIGANAETMISARSISMEPMYIILNLGLSNKFQTVEWTRLTFPAVYLVDYVRVYQRSGETNVGCDPADYPTAEYINKHMNAYTNPNYTTWEEAGYSWPKNSLKDSC